MYQLYQSPSEFNWSSSTSIFLYVNAVTSGVFGWFSLLCIYIIFAMGVSYYKKDITIGVSIAGFITVILAILFRILTLINNVHLGITIVIAVLGLIMFLFGKTKE
jgi:hypothetical protein